MDEIEGYVKLSKEHIESSYILLEAKKYRSSISSSYYTIFLLQKHYLLKKVLKLPNILELQVFLDNILLKGKVLIKRYINTLLELKLLENKQIMIMIMY